MKKFIKIYLWIMLVVFPLSLLSDILDETPLGVIDYTDYMFFAVALLGVWGYCYEKKILNRAFWKTYLPCVVVWDIYATYKEAQLYPELATPLLFGICLIAIFIILLPEYIGLYCYGYRENKTTPNNRVHSIACSARSE